MPYCASGQCRIVLVTRRTISCDENISLLDAGFNDVVRWQGRKALAEYIRERSERWQRIEDILQSELVETSLVGHGKVWLNFLRSVIEATLYSRSNLLITGESGTGKELVSRLVHTLGKQEESAKLVLVDCSTVMNELSGSEFFGHEKGSYTSAASSREGAFALAHGGTLFLDEIGELPLRMQAELLRVIQEGAYKKIGSNTWQHTAFRLICATNRDLKQMISEKTFRGDLFYRISDVEIRVPSLHERREDVLALAEHFLREFYSEHHSGKDAPAFDDNVKAFLMNKTYSGNVRELRQLVRRIAMRHIGCGSITLSAVPPGDRHEEQEAARNGSEFLPDLESSIRHSVLKGANLFDIKNSAAFIAIKVALDLERGSRQKAAERLHITPRAIQQYFKKRNGPAGSSDEPDQGLHAEAMGLT
jgi:transcriptional regulator with GAF, ATPase, and Fis domain